MDVFDAATRSRVMSKVKGRDTGPELAVRRMLHAADHRFRLHRRDLPGSPDIVLPRRRAVVFVHGCFWHDHAGCRHATKPASNAAFWAAKLARTVARDAAAETALTALGWTVLTVWECELRDKPAVIARLDAALRTPEPDAAEQRPHPSASR